MRPASVVILAVSLLFLAACGGKGSLPAQDPLSLARSAQSNSNAAQRTTLTYIALPAPYAHPWAFLNSADGALWFAEWNTDTNGNPGSGEAGIGRIALDGSVSETPLPSEVAPILGAFQSGGNLWFGDYGGSSNAQPGSFDVLRSDGTVSSYPVFDLSPTGVNLGNPKVRFSAAASDGNVWYALLRANKIARVAPDGSFTTFAVPSTAQGQPRPNDIVFGPDNALWFAEQSGDAIGRMTLDGTVTNVFTVPAESQPRFIAVGRDGALWFTENGSQIATGTADNSAPPQIVRMTTSGQMTAFAMPPNSGPDSIRAATGGFVFTDLGNNAVGFIDYSGNVVEYPIAYFGGPFGTVQFALQGSDGSLYFADDDFNRIGKITLDKKGLIFPQVMTFPEPPNLTGATNTQIVGVGVLGDRGPFSASTDNPSVATVAPIAGFPLNFMVTATGRGSTTLTIKGKGEPMTASITVNAASVTTQSVRFGRQSIHPF